MDIHVSTAGITTVPAGSSTVILWDSTADTGTGVTLSKRRSWPRVRRGIVRVFMDQNATFKYDDLARNSTTWRTVNNGGAGEAITTSTLFESDQLLIGDDSRFIIVTGTVPTVWEVSVRLVEDDRALGQ